MSFGQGTFPQDGPRGQSKSSARHALFDVLRRIGGLEAEAATLQTLMTTAVPWEIALLKDAALRRPRAVQARNNPRALRQCGLKLAVLFRR